MLLQSVFILLAGAAAICSGIYVSNLSSACIRCLCEAASGCNTTIGCKEGYCGPFWVSRIYWAQAGKIILPDDDLERPEAYSDCAIIYSCGARIVEHHMADVGKDCNGDGVTDCDDYAAIHYKGVRSCSESMAGSNFLKRYDKCRPSKFQDDDDFYG